ncbi:unnamed protein product [Lampetra fluviatilis]
MSIEELLLVVRLLVETSMSHPVNPLAQSKRLLQQCEQSLLPQGHNHRLDVKCAAHHAGKRSETPPPGVEEGGSLKRTSSCCYTAGRRRWCRQRSGDSRASWQDSPGDARPLSTNGRSSQKRRTATVANAKPSTNALPTSSLSARHPGGAAAIGAASTAASLVGKMITHLNNAAFPSPPYEGKKPAVCGGGSASARRNKAASTRSW